MSTMIAEALDNAVDELVPLVGARAACEAVGLPRASYYRGLRGCGGSWPVTDVAESPVASVPEATQSGS